ncbi:unnamed protein product [Rotaria sp. Silwood1]|nr:unnamed protein product [Rotaria sp. Silwood1]
MASLKASTLSTNSSNRLNTTINPGYACYWSDSCRGLHELNQCPYRNAELHGKLDVYYSSIGIYKRFSVDKLSHVSLKGNPTGRTMVHLLIYTIRSQGEIEILFGLGHRKNTSSEETRCPLLSLPLTRPCKRGESGMQMARRALEWVTS